MVLELLVLFGSCLGINGVSMLFARTIGSGLGLRYCAASVSLYDRVVTS